MPKKFRGNSVTVEAVSYNGHVTLELAEFLEGVSYKAYEDRIMLPTLIGHYIVRPGDWIVKDQNGEFYPAKDSIFSATYELLEDEIY